jgi:hypothetical protein
MQNTIKQGILVGLLTLAGPGSAHATEAPPKMEFQIRDPQTREVFFQGYERVTDTGPNTRKETFFFDMNRKEALVEDAVYNRDSLRMESYVSRSSVTGEETIMKTEGQRIQIKYRPEKDDAFKETTLSWSADTLHGKVFDDLITRNWDKLLQGQMLKFDLVLPFRLESRGFQIFHNRRVSNQGQELEVFSLQPQNFLLRAFVPKMEFYYARSSPKPELKIFTGPSVIPIRGETNRMVEIIYGLSGAPS